MRRLCAALVAGLFGAVSAEASMPSEPINVWIATEPDAGGGAVFVGYATANSARTLRYELVGEKRGSGGQSHVHQGGQVELGQDVPARLSQVSFGRINEADHYTISLRVYDGTKLIGETAAKN